MEIPPLGSQVEERMGQGSSFKEWAKSKLKQGQTKAALMDFCYASLRFYQAAVAMEAEERRAQAQDLLVQTGRYAVGCAATGQQAKLELSEALLYYMAAVCFGRAFTVTAATTRLDHKAVQEVVREKRMQDLDARQLSQVVDASQNVYKSLECYRYAQKLAGKRIVFPPNLLLQPESALVKFLDEAVNVIHANE